MAGPHQPFGLPDSDLPHQKYMYVCMYLTMYVCNDINDDSDDTDNDDIDIDDNDDVDNNH